jgi:hypothetical protein
MRRVDNVRKSSDYTEERNETFSDIPSVDPKEVLSGVLGGSIFKGLGEIGNLGSFSGLGRLSGLKNDVTTVCNALTNFPYRSAFNVIGLITVLYIAFNLFRKFGMIK